LLVPAPLDAVLSVDLERSLAGASADQSLGLGGAGRERQDGTDG
jgi:hypothetical protein